MKMNKFSRATILMILSLTLMLTQVGFLAFSETGQHDPQPEGSAAPAAEREATAATDYRVLSADELVILNAPVAAQSTSSAFAGTMTATYAGYTLPQTHTDTGSTATGTDASRDFVISAPVSTIGGSNQSITLAFSDDIASIQTYAGVTVSGSGRTRTLALPGSFPDGLTKVLDVKIGNTNATVSIRGAAMIRNSISGSGTLSYTDGYPGSSLGTASRSEAVFFSPAHDLYVTASPNSDYRIYSASDFSFTGYSVRSSTYSHSSGTIRYHIGKIESRVYAASMRFTRTSSSSSGSGGYSRNSSYYNNNNTAVRRTYRADSNSSMITKQGDYSWRVDLPHLGFYDAYVDGQKLERGVDYKVKSGSTVLTLTNSYLNSLKSGSHSLRMEFVSADALIDFNVQKKSGSSTTTPLQPNTTPPPSANNSNPSMGADLSISLAQKVGFLIGIGLGLCSVAVYLHDRRRYRYKVQ